MEAVATLNQQETYQVHLPQFEGPFDLLLFFIQRDELDIRDIPISRITKDFLAYMHQAKQFQMNLAADFIVVAAQLMKIKARMLLPRPKLTEDGQVEDPRQELVDRLLEYQRYKEAMKALEQLEEAQINRYKRGYVKAEAEEIVGEGEPTDELTGVTLYGLLKIYKRLLERVSAESKRPRHVIQAYPYTMEDVREEVYQLVQEKGQLSFVDLILTKADKFYLVFSFLVILELINQRKITVVLGDGYNNFWLKQVAEEMAEAVAEIVAETDDEPKEL